MRLSRRDFLHLSGAGLGGLLLGKPSSAGKTGKGMLYDASKCVGCRACQMACKDWNELPSESKDLGGIYEPSPPFRRHVDTDQVGGGW